MHAPWSVARAAGAVKPALRYARPVLTVLTWFAARRSRKALPQLVGELLGPALTLFAFLADRYTSESSLRPFAPLADKLGDRMQVVLLAEWPQEQRERDGEELLRGLGLSAEARALLLRDDGDERMAVVLRRRQPVALINLFFRERRQNVGDAADRELCAWEAQALETLESLLARLPAAAPEPPRALAPDQHEFLSTGMCRRCGEGVGSLLGCGVKRVVDSAPARDRFELIELD